MFLLQQAGTLPMRLSKKKKNELAGDGVTADTVVEGIMTLIMVMLNPSCYSDSSNVFSG